MSSRVQIPMKPAAAPGQLLAATEPVQSLKPAPSGILRRKCACGGAASSGGGCEDCKKKRSTLQRFSSGQPLDGGTRGFFEPRFGHDFRKVRIHPEAVATNPACTVNVPAKQGSCEAQNLPMPASQTTSAVLLRPAASGQIARMPAIQTRLAPGIGGDGGAPPSGQQVAKPPAGGSAGASVTLGYSPVTPPTKLPCGGFDWKIAWTLNGAGRLTDGFVLQKVYVHYSHGNCNQPAADSAMTYWEAWQVQKGQVLNTLGLPGTDRFQADPAANYFGMRLKEGFAKFLPNYTEPLKWGTLQHAGATWATYDPPRGWSDAGSLHRSIRSEFNCCYGATDTNIETVG